MMGAALRCGTVLLLLLVVAGVTAMAGEEDLRRENARLRDELSALKGADPAAAMRKAVDEYLAAADATKLPRQPATVDYQGGFTLRTQDGLHLLRINVLLQTGWNWFKATETSSVAERAGFEMDTLRLRFSGHAFSERLAYFIDLEFAPQADRFDTSPDTVSEAWLTYRRIPWDQGRFKGGRYRARFSSSDEVCDEALALCERGLVSEYFAVGRVDGLAVLLENLLDGRSAFEVDAFNGSERFDAGDPFSGAKKDIRFSLSMRWSTTILGRGDPHSHLAYEGDPYDSPEEVLVAGAGFHYEPENVARTPSAEFYEIAADLMYRRAGRYAALNLYARYNIGGATAGLTEDDWDLGAQATLSWFFVPREMEVALRAGWTHYAAHMDPGGDLVELTAGFGYYWTDGKWRPVGSRLRVNLDLGWAQNIAQESRWTNWPAGDLRGLLFRSQITILF